MKTILILLRSVALVILLLCLLQPIVNLSSAGLREGYIGLLIDNSASMSIRDTEQSRSRGEEATEMLYGEAGLIEQLQKNFTLRVFAFDRSARPLPDPGMLSFAGSKTHTAAAMQQAAEALAGLPFEALVLVTDGVDNSSEDPLLMASVINAGDTPVHVIGVGADMAASDTEISQVSTSGLTVEGGIFEAQITVRSRGYAGRESDLLIEAWRRGRCCQENQTGDLTVRSSDTPLQLTPKHEGAMVYTARLPLQENEMVKENNELPFLVENPRKQVDILYIEGHPRNEYKFIRRAAGTDKALRLKTYLMTGPQKFLRQGIDSSLELSKGYPVSEEELFKYDAVIFGDVARNLFTDEQLSLTRDFVARRGGWLSHAWRLYRL